VKDSVFTGTAKNFPSSKRAHPSAIAVLKLWQEREFLLVISLSAIIAFLGLGSSCFFDVEASFAQAAKEMMERGDLLTPFFNGEARFDKPILFYWLILASYKIFGISEFAARFPSALSGLLLSVSLFSFMNIIGRKEIALLSSLFFCLSFYFLSFTHAAVVDMTFTLFLSLSLFSFFLYAEGCKRMIYGFYVFSALAFLTKGLIGILIPFCVVLLYSLYLDRRKAIAKLFNPRGICLFAIVALPWFVAEVSMYGMDFFYEFVIKHHFVRYTQVLSGHKGPFYFYIPLTLIGFFPWIIFLPHGLRKAPTASLELFASIWSLFTFLFFSISKTKYPSYILPMFPPLAMIAASGKNSERPTLIFLCLLSFAFGLFVLLFPFFLPFELEKPERFCLYGLSANFALSFGVGLYGLVRKSEIVRPLSALMLCLLLFTSFFVIRSMALYLQGEVTTFSLYARGQTDRSEEIAAFGTNNPAIVFYSERRVKKFKDVEALKAFAEGKQRLFVIARKEYSSRLKDVGFFAVREGKNYALLAKE